MRLVLSPTGPAVLAHRARAGRGLEGRWPHVLARRAHRIDRSGQWWTVCSPDARSLRRPGHLPEEQRIDQMVVGRCAQGRAAWSPCLRGGQGSLSDSCARRPLTLEGDWSMRAVGITQAASAERKSRNKYVSARQDVWLQDLALFQ